MKKPLGLRLEESLIERVDAARSGVSRTVFVERALELALGGSPGTERSPVSGDVVPIRGSSVADRSRPLRAVSSSNAKAGVFPVGWRSSPDDVA